jgi:hypothetical protein
MCEKIWEGYFQSTQDCEINPLELFPAIAAFQCGGLSCDQGNSPQAIAPFDWGGLHGS